MKIELIYKESSSGKMLINNDNFKEILRNSKRTRKLGRF